MKGRTTTWRLLDTGIRTASENITLDSALLEAKAKGISPSTIRFLQFNPPCALIGFHQTVEQEIRTDFCKENGININRRITGGGAIYFDAAQLGWEVIASRADFTSIDIQGLTKKICDAAASGLKRFGINAGFRPRNDIEVKGRKISGTGGVFDGDAFLYQGTLLIDFDVESMLKSLRIPTEKLTAKGLNSAKERVTSIKHELGYLPSLEKIKEALASGFSEHFKIKLEEGSLIKEEISLYKGKVSYFNSRKWVYSAAEPSDKMRTVSSVYKKDGGLIRVNLKVDLQRQIVRQALITGDFFINPSKFILDLEATLKDIYVDNTIAIAERFFDEENPEMLQLTKYDFINAIKLAIEKLDYSRLGIKTDDANSLFLIKGPFPLNPAFSPMGRRKKDEWDDKGEGLGEILKNAGVLLLPYCAKPPECEYRNIDGCSKCGLCSIGDAYRMAEEKDLKPITITNYEHLKETLQSLKANGTKSYIGCCCESFFVKRHDAFADAGMEGVLIDIENTTCYELKKEEAAYKGNFQEKTEIKIELLKKLFELRSR